MAGLFRAADVSVSLTSHDGTPNSLLEAMGSGCLPVVSPVESVLEWVDDGVNGLVASATDVKQIAATLHRAVTDTALRDAAARRNQRLVHERANIDVCMGAAMSFYERLISSE